MTDQLSKFNIKGTLVDVIDVEARSDLAMHSESIYDLQSEFDSQSAAYSEMFSEVDNEITSGLSKKQNNLTKWGNFSGNIDDLNGETGETWQYNGVYFCDASNVTGTLPYSSGFFTLIVLKNIQIAFPYKTPANDTSPATVKFRDHTNGWRLWRGASFTV